jgi:superfamily II DNA/RNA helicase
MTMFTENDKTGTPSTDDVLSPTMAVTAEVAEVAGPNGFEAMGLHSMLTRALADAGYSQPTEVQSRAIPAAMAGQDMMVSSSTGSGKTASFVLPALMRVLAAREQQRAAAPAKVATTAAAGTDEARPRRDRGPATTGPRILVLTPTRELAMQVAKAASDYGRHVGGLRVATIVGGVPYGAQLKALRGPLDVLIATPGRLIDHMESGKALLSGIEMLVLDEADRMLDMGFIEPIQHIAAATPSQRQTLMFSATFAGHVGRLAQDLLRNPQRIEVASHTETHADIEQRLHWADDFEHKNALLDHILTERDMEQALVFTSTQRDADWLADRLADMGHHVASLHGGHPQGRRTRVLQGLRNKQLKILVATDVAARGIDVPSITHVINFGMPMKEEDYVHRIGRTGRAGRAGLAVTLAERRDSGMVHRIQRFTTQRIPAAVIEGLEPKRAAPSLAPAGRPPFGAKPAGKSFGPKPGGRPFKPAGKSFSNRGGFGGAR